MKFKFRFVTKIPTAAPTLEDIMLKGDADETWVAVFEKLGVLLADIRKSFDAADASKVFESESIGKQTRLAEWIDKIDDSWDNVTKTINPESRLKNLDFEINHPRRQAADVLGRANCVCLDNFITKNIQSQTDQQYVQVNLNEICLAYGPLGIEVAILLADILIKYHQQLTLEHNIRYVTSDCAKNFGRSFNTKFGLNASDRRDFWTKVSLLTGWEIIRRVNEDEALCKWSREAQTDLDDIFEAGLRLISNRLIESIDFMIPVALAELY
ncbi:hypothetical protein Bhyg_01277 [Pseudolycoriella hygida]|uniref:Uncharacterized protein n=1 Tax=Pseudolycoriella hygida TaxID=35572 RepID=A0A9Q0N990_9DIPT|nr:hypothetical protein Bhyg_01277 [Pseudolycoriella hygida]